MAIAQPTYPIATSGLVTHVGAYADSLASPNPLPSDFGLTTWAYPPMAATANPAAAPTAGNVVLVRNPVRVDTTFTNAWAVVITAGTGATALANVFLGVYDKNGTLRGSTADQSTAFATAGAYSPALTVAGGQTLAIPASDGYCYWACLVGTQSTTAVTLLRSATTVGIMNLTQTPSTTPPAAFMQKTGAATALPATITFNTCTTVNNATWGGLT